MQIVEDIVELGSLWLMKCKLLKINVSQREI